MVADLRLVQDAPALVGFGQDTCLFDFPIHRWPLRTVGGPRELAQAQGDSIPSNRRSTYAEQKVGLYPDHELPPNGLGLNCGATLECSQTDGLQRRKAPSARLPPGTSHRNRRLHALLRPQPLGHGLNGRPLRLVRQPKWRLLPNQAPLHEINPFLQFCDAGAQLGVLFTERLNPSAIQVRPSLSAVT